MSIDLKKNKSQILAAWKDVIDDKSATNWAVFGYEGQTDVLNVVCKGNDGIDEMKEELNSGKIMYAFCKVLDPKTSLNKYVLINWQGEGAPLLRKGVCANHVRDVSNILKGAHVSVNARAEEDVDSDVIIDKVSKSTASTYSFEERLDLSKDGFQKIDPAYKKVEPTKEINPVERDKFWALEEEREKQRQLEEMKKKREESLKLEEERLKREAEDAKKREDAMATENIPGATKVSKEIKQAHINITNKIEQIEKSKDSVNQLKEVRKKETETLISQRTADVRAVFERNTSAGQILATNSSLKEVKKTNTTALSDKENSVFSTHILNQEEGTVVDKETNENLKHERDYCHHVSNDQALKNAEVYTNGLADDGLKAQALYDYQAADETEISFDPDDIITQIEQIDPGWWQGLGPDGRYGLFPANYVQLIP